MKSTNIYWIYLEPYTIISRNLSEILVYNTISGKSKIFKNEGSLVEIINSLLDENNMYCITINEETFKKNTTQSFLNFIRKSYSGDFVKTSNLHKRNLAKKPVIMFPSYSLQKELSVLKENNSNINNKLPLKLLNEIYIQLTGTCMRIPVKPDTRSVF